MLRKSLIVSFGFLGALLVGTAAGTAPASAHYRCGSWNGWCASKYWVYPGYRYGWYGHSYKKWGHSHYKSWNKGKGKGHYANKGRNWKKRH